MRRYFDKKSGFTIIELLIVIMIIGVLVGVAVPYYNDYIYDSRLSVLKQNLATMRNVINQFRGDRSRGPFRVQVHNGGVAIHYPTSSDNTNGSELVAGTFIPDGASFKRQTTVKYITAIPVFTDPQDGTDIRNTIAFTNDATACFVDDDGDNAFDIDTEFSFFDLDNDGAYDANVDQEYFDIDGGGPGAGIVKKLDYLDFTVTASDGTVY